MLHGRGPVCFVHCRYPHQTLTPSPLNRSYLPETSREQTADAALASSVGYHGLPAPTAAPRDIAGRHRCRVVEDRSSLVIWQWL